MKNNTREFECAHARWVVHGKRRRRCARCGKTKTVWRRKRGRKRCRAPIAALTSYLLGKTASASTRRLRQARDQFNRTSRWFDISVLPAPYLLIADAVHIRTHTYRVITHGMLLASAYDNRAWILPPYFDDRGETASSWQCAFAALSPWLISRVQALVCDGKSGLLRLARSHGWLIQRCQFHLIARLQLKRSKYALSRHRQEGIRLYELAKTVCTTRSDRALANALRVLATVARAESNRYLKTILSGFVKHHQDYRTFLRHPELNLPRTTNAVESLNSLIRSLTRRMRGFENAASARAWIEALLKHRQYINLNTKRHRN